ncbi:mobilization protein [Muricauda oceani]|uniref:Mobilization protein n=1 Tax=Flagellimonas oceani TaxID=2698672 RepID=A0A6G7IZR7_9FLAO|nr:MobB family relaxase [Allomuricauda oceani]MBW8244852.1 mobilization protein [Allomuricauda oceani]QII43838.1 mobilization protein [Allomuricauda oceani]
MYITITPQKLGGSYLQSASDFVAYLEKENKGKELEEQEHFFDQYGEGISPREVIRDIDGNTAKLKKKEPRFYSITVNPSRRELKHLQDHPRDLKTYTRKLMKEYAKSFHREIDGRKVNVNDIVYYAKIEHQRTYKGNDRAIRENAPYSAKIARLRNEIQQIEQGKLNGSVKRKREEIERLEATAPHRLNGRRITQGMAKEGSQAHIHIIVSRKDRSNRYSLSPGSKYKASEVKMNGKTVKRGFDRNRFFESSERLFDAQFRYKRNYVETYRARKTLVKHPPTYFANLMGLPANERSAAFKLLAKTGINIPLANIPTNKAQLAYKLFKQLKKGIDRGIRSGSIGI